MSMATAAAAIDFIGLLTDTCTIRRYVAGTQGSHGPTGKTWSDYATLVEGRLDSGAGREIPIGEEMVVPDFVWFTRASQDITEKDRIRTVVRGGVTIVSEDCDVILVETPGGTNHHKEVALAFTRT